MKCAGRQVDIKPVFKPDVNDLKKAPESAGQNNDPGKSAVDYETFYCFFCEQPLSEKNISPPGENIKIILKRVNSF